MSFFKSWAIRIPLHERNASRAAIIGIVQGETLIILQERGICVERIN